MAHLRLRLDIVREIGSLGFVTLARQAVTSITYLLLNNILFNLGGEASVAVYAIISRVLMFALFPAFGVTQGFRVRETIYTAIKYAALVSALVFVLLMVFPEAITSLFLGNGPNVSPEEAETSRYVLEHAPYAMRWVFAATPIIALQLIGAAYFQAVGKAIPALLLTLTRQGFFFIPLVIILPHLWLFLNSPTV